MTADMVREHADWQEAVAAGATILGLAEWLDLRDEAERVEMHEEAFRLASERESLHASCTLCAQGFRGSHYPSA